MPFETTAGIRPVRMLGGGDWRGIADALETGRAEAADALLELVGDARVVAIGEGAHSISEFTAIADGVFRLLARELGFTAFVAESGFAEGLSIDRWIGGRAGEVSDIARAGISYGFGESEAVHRQLAWMRGQRSRGAGRLRFYGMDLPGSSTSPGPAVRACLERIPPRTGDADLLRRSDLGGRAEAAAAHAAMDEAERRNLHCALAELASRAEASGDPVARRCGESLTAFVEEALGEPPPGEPYPRERFMARTVGWVLEREPRIVVSAHNAHVRRTPLHGRPSLGALLASEFGDALRVVGTTYGAGPEVRFAQRSDRPFDCEVTREERSPRPGTVEALIEAELSERPTADAALVLPSRLPAGRLAALAGTQAAGGVDPVEDFPGSFDAILHLRRVTAVPGAFERLRAELDGAPDPAASPRPARKE